MAPVAAFCCVLLLLGIAVAQPSYHVDNPGDSCCYGRATFSNGQTVSVLPECCVSLTCHDGDIVPRHYGPPGSSGCCEFDGQIYQSGALLSSYCVSLVCHQGNWTYSHAIEECCEMCKVYNDPHLVTFDGYRYDWHGLCNYTITQRGSTHHPDIGVFSDFRPCFSGLPGASCLHMTTFKNDENTVIRLNHSPASVATVLVNSDGVSSIFVVPATGVHSIQSTSGVHPVLSWRDEDCIFLAGSSRILVRHCHNKLMVWVYPTHNKKLDGLCGHFNFYQNDDMTNRDGTVHPLQPWPLAFPESWKTDDQADETCLTPCPYCKETTVNPCNATPRELFSLKHRCGKVLNAVIGRDKELLHHVESCAWDVCMAMQAEASIAEQQQWIDEAKKIVQDVKMMAVKASGSWQPASPPSTGVCSPGSRWKHECYWCTCHANSSNDCAVKLCPANYEHEAGTDSCTDGSWWLHDECNWCECVRGGQICTYNECTNTHTQTVHTPPTEVVCLYALDTGSCQQYEYRYYYNFRDGKCVGFRYSGCGGNPNNFMTKEDCERTCGHLTVQSSAYTTAVTYTTTITNPRPARCILQPDSGPCEALVQRYYYNTTTNSCEHFTYGGCGGNYNNFEYERDCEEVCGVPSQVSTNLAHTLPPTCSLQLDVGYCNERTTRYYYSPQTLSCIPFIYTGCGGNENNFPSREFCEAICYVTSTTEPTYASLEAVCSLPPDSGSCYENSIRYYYDAQSRTCKAFTYGGCDGNYNNFPTEEWCMASCYVAASATSLSERCFLKYDVGTCYQSLWRWYYDHENRRCKVFVYGGCDGNNNRFRTEEECETACGGLSSAEGSIP